jgi:hypothetical protein
MNPNRRLSIAATILAVALTTASHAAAQCPTTLPASLVASVRNPEARAAAQSFRVDAATIAQAGGLATMIAQLKGQIAADQATAAEEERNQRYLTQNGMGNDKRAADGRLVLELMEDAGRLNTAMLQILECLSRSGAAGASTGSLTFDASAPARTSFGDAAGAPRSPEILAGSAATPSMSAAMTTARNAFNSRGVGAAESRGSGRPSATGADLGQALEDLSRTFRDRALVNASPEVAAFYAKQDAMRANTQANLAAVGAGQARGLEDARRGSLDAQMEMVTSAVKGWRAPSGYARSGGVNASAIQDPFATEARIDSVEAAMAASGLSWDRARGLARVGDNRTLCGGRLKAGDYPVLVDGTLLDTADRITKFLSICGDATMPLLVVRETGDVEVRK